MKDRTALLALVAFVALGLPDGMLGPAWPAIRKDLGQPLAALGELTALISTGFVVSSLVSARVQRRLGPGTYVALGGTGSAVALAVFASSHWWAGLLAASLTLGLFAGCVDSGFNGHVALNHGPRLMNALHACYGAGTTLGPLVVAAALATGSWRWAWAAAAAFAGTVSVVLWASRKDFPAAPPERWRDVAPSTSTMGATVLMLALFFLIVGIEVGIGAWSATVLEHRGMSNGRASVWVASYWACFTAGRIALAAAGRRLAPETTVRAGAGLTLLGVAVFQWSPVGLPVAGLGLAGLFPALVTLTPFRLGADRARAAIGYQFAAGTVGATAIVGAAGLTAQFVGIGALVPFFVASAVLLVALELVAGR